MATTAVDAMLGHLSAYDEGARTPMLKLLEARDLCRELHANGFCLRSVERFAHTLRDLHGAAFVAISHGREERVTELAVPSGLLMAKWPTKLCGLLEATSPGRAVVLSKVDSMPLFRSRRKAMKTAVLVPLEGRIAGASGGALLIGWAEERQLADDERIALSILGQDLSMALDTATLDELLPTATNRPAEITEAKSRAGLIDLAARENFSEYEADNDWVEHEKNDFLSLVAHELRTPLTPVSMLLQSLEQKAREGTVDVEAIVLARRQVRRLTNLISNLLDVSDTSTPPLEFNLQPLDLVRLVADTVETFRSTSHKHTIDLHIAGAPLYVNGDEARLEEVIVNLFDNAVKYSPAGGTVRIEAERTGNQVTLSVTDQGIGIPKEDQDRLFAPFFRAKNASNRKFQGFGLGLHRAEAAIRRHGGQMSISSEVGRGSRFAFTLPAAETESGLAMAKAPARLLVVDDDPDILQVVGDLLEEAGFEVLRAHDGAEALRYIETALPDLVLLDLMMPVLDGWEVLGRLRNPERWCPIPIVVLSAHNTLAEQASLLHADAYLGKPFDVDALIRKVREILVMRGGAQSREAAFSQVR